MSNYSFSLHSFSLFDVDNNMLARAERVCWFIGGSEGRDKALKRFPNRGNGPALVIAQKQPIIYINVNNMVAIRPAGRQMNKPASFGWTIVSSVGNHSFIE